LGIGLAAAAAWCYGARVLRAVAAPAPLVARSVVARGLRVHTLAAEPDGAREAAPVVLLHGWGVSGRYLVPTALAIAREDARAVYVPDLPGHGRSDRPARALDVAELAEVVLGWMDALGLRRAVLVANSFGCQIAAELAVRAPSRVLALALVGPTLDPAVRPLPLLVPRLLLTGLFEPVSLVPILAADYAVMGPRLLLAELRRMRADRIERRLSRVAQPALVVRGERDAVASAAWAARVASLLGDAAASTLARRAHAVNYSASAELVRLLRPLLAAADAAVADAGGRAPASSAPSPGHR
jgi:pimeloyl-ACP methyl ester carboxylesterase